MELDDKYLENIEDFVLEKQQVLTYKWLSSQLAVPFDLAKQMLFEFKRQKKHAVYCTYVLGGVPVDSDELTFALIREEDLEQSKKRFRELVCQHVYSVGPSRPELLETIFAAENPRFVDLLQDPKSAQTVNYLTNRFSPIANEEVVHKLSGAFRPAYLSPKQATPETKWADSFQKLEVTDSMAATKRKIGFVLDEKKKSSTPTAAGTPKDVAPAGTLPTTASVPAASGKKGGKKGAKPAEKFVLPDVPEVDEPVLPPPPKGSLAAFLSSGGRKESDPKKANLAAPMVEKKPFFGAVKAKKAATVAPPPPSPSKKQKKEEPESGGASASKRLKKRDSKHEADEEEVKIIGSDDEIFMEDKSSSSDKEKELPPIAEEAEQEEEEEEEKQKTPKKSPRKKATPLPKIDAGWVQHLKSPRKSAVRPKIRTEVERVDDNGYTVFEEQWVEDPNWVPAPEEEMLAVKPEKKEEQKQEEEEEEEEEKPKPKKKKAAPKKKKKADEAEEEVKEEGGKKKRAKKNAAEKKADAGDDEVVLHEEEEEKKEPPPPKKPSGILNFFQRAPKK